MTIAFNGDATVAMGVPPSKDRAPVEDMLARDEEDSNSKEHETTSASGWTQVRALMEKNALTKVRTPGATIAEMLSPVLLCLVLFISYNLSEIVHYPAKYYHSINADFPLFWDSGAYNDDEAEDFDLADTHRRRTLEDGELTAHGWEQLAQQDNKEHWTWNKLLEAEGFDPAEPEEDFGLISDFLMMRNLKTFSIIDEEEEALAEEDDELLEPASGQDDELVQLPAEENPYQGGDSGDWYEEILADIKKGTVDKIDWPEVEQEIKDNFGVLWDTAKEYLLASSTRSTKSSLRLMRIRVRTN